MSTNNQKVNSNGETMDEFAKRFSPGNYLTVEPAYQPDDYMVRHGSNVLALIAATNIEIAMAEARTIFNKEVIGIF